MPPMAHAYSTNPGLVGPGADAVVKMRGLPYKCAPRASRPPPQQGGVDGGVSTPAATAVHARTRACMRSRSHAAHARRWRRQGDSQRHPRVFLWAERAAQRRALDVQRARAAHWRGVRGFLVTG
eukprot:3883381-Prymnesium_polylepis.1